MRDAAGAPVRRVTVVVVAAALAGAFAGTAQSARSPKALFRALLKQPPASGLPPELGKSTVHAAPLSQGARAYHAVGAVEFGNTQAIVGYLVFHSRAEALADLKAFPPNRGPNRIVAKNPPGIPHPALVLHASGNGFHAAYVVFVQDNVLVDCWTYGSRSTKTSVLFRVVKQDARWASRRLLQARRGTG